MGFIIRVFLGLLIAAFPALALIVEGEYEIPGDLIDIKYAPFHTLYFRVSKNSEFEICDMNALLKLKFSLVEFAVKKSEREAISSFGITLKTRLGEYLQREVISRERWGAKTSKPGMTLDRVKKNFAIHHSEGSAISSAETLKSIQNYHMNEKKWPDIGYHFLIGRDGVCYEGRELCWQGAHVSNHNQGNIGICFLGCFETSVDNDVETTAQMVSTITNLIGMLAAHYGIEISPKTLKGHKEYEGAKTLCPGDLVMARLDEIIAYAHHRP